MSSLDWYRAAFIAVLMAFVVIVKPTRIARRLEEFFLERSSAAALALLRIMAFAYLARVASRSKASTFSSLPEWMLDMPPGWGMLEPLFPLDLELVVWLERSLLVASVLACVGLWGRYSMLCAGLLAPLVVGIPNLYGKVNHGNHVVVLWGMILAFSPATDALSLDWLLRRLRGALTPEPARRYALPLRFAWLMLALSYFFAGFWKLWDCGDLYFNGSRVKSEMVERWASREWVVPLVRIDESDLLLSFLGGWTILLELGVLFAIFVPLGRVLVVPQLIAFHVGVRYTLGITFKWLVPLALLFDLPWLARRVPTFVTLRARVEPWVTQKLDAARDRLAWSARWPARPLKRRSVIPTWLMGGALTFGMVCTGALELDTQPVTVFPRFSSRNVQLPKRGQREELILVRAGSDVEEDITRRARMPPARRKQWFKRLLKLQKKRRKKGLKRDLRAFAKHVEPESGPIQPGDTLLLYRLTWPVDPDEREGRFKRRVQARLHF